MRHFDKALQIADQYRDSLGPAAMDRIYGVVYGNKAQVALAQNHLAEAESLSLKSITLNDRPGYEVENAMGVKLQLANVYCRMENYPRMAAVLFGLSAGIKEANAQMQMEWNRLLAGYYQRQSKPDSVLHYFKAYAALKDAIAAEQKQLTAADVDRQLTEKENNLQIAVLKKDKQLAVISLWVTITLSSMVLIILYLIHQHYRRSKRSLAISLALNEEIKEQKATREAEEKKRHKLITEAVIHAQENERSLIGLELHDNINQVLTTVKLLNEMVLAGVGDANLLLPKSLSYLQDCINEIRSLSKRLSAPTLGKISLEESVEDLIESINMAGKVKITRYISGLHSPYLKKDLHIGVYRILQEQLNNVLKHADASEVHVQLEQKDDQLFLSVQDNGKGFATQNRKVGIGLMNMQTRAENLNGTFELNSQPGDGCKLRVVLPCVREN